MDVSAESRPAPLAVPCALAFISSFGVMMVEMAAGRMMAAYVGAGLYSWTSVIGVVLGGITIGNWTGGRLADRFPVRQAISVLFLLGAAACLALPLLAHWVARWMSWDSSSSGSFPLRVAMQVIAAFLFPAVALGLIGPAVAKMAIEGAREKGRTVGNVYAWGALGSIFGTFASGYYLIGILGSSGVVLAVSLVLAVVGFILAPRIQIRIVGISWPLLGGLLAGSLLVAGLGIGKWAWIDGRPGVRERDLYNWIYKRESQYSFIRVGQSIQANSRSLFMDNLVHAIYSPQDPKALMYPYEQIYAVITERHGRVRERLRTFFIGGGGYVFPRHIRRAWPQSVVEVAEIDPAVTEANFQAFGLKPEEVEIRDSGKANAQTPPEAPQPILVFHLDARNHVEDLLRQKHEGGRFEPFDFVYGDAFNDYCVPFHLVTKEFMEKVRELLEPSSGVYLMNVIDIFDSGRFLGAIYNTLKAVFPHVYVLTNTQGGPSADPNARDTFIVAASLCELDLQDIGKREGEAGSKVTVFEPSHLKLLEDRSRRIVLTDDYSPVENLLDVVVRRRGYQPGKQ